VPKSIKNRICCIAVLLFGLCIYVDRVQEGIIFGFVRGAVWSLFRLISRFFWAGIVPISWCSVFGCLGALSITIPRVFLFPPPHGESEVRLFEVMTFGKRSYSVLEGQLQFLWLAIFPYLFRIWIAAAMYSLSEIQFVIRLIGGIDIAYWCFNLEQLRGVGLSFRILFKKRLHRNSLWIHPKRMTFFLEGC